MIDPSQGNEVPPLPYLTEKKWIRPKLTLLLTSGAMFIVCSVLGHYTYRFLMRPLLHSLRDKLLLLCITLPIGVTITIYGVSIIIKLFQTEKRMPVE